MTRLIWFYDETERAVIVCTHCFRKPAGEKYAPEQKKAGTMRSQYLACREAEQTVAKQVAGEGGQKSPKKHKSKTK